MRELVILFVHAIATLARLLGPGGDPRDSAGAGQTARVHAPVRTGFHQQAALEGV